MHFSEGLCCGCCRRKDGEWRWANTDAQVQGQAVRAIAAFVAAIPPRPFPVSHLQVTFITGKSNILHVLMESMNSELKKSRFLMFANAGVAHVRLFFVFSFSSSPGSPCLHCMQPIASQVDQFFNILVLRDTVERMQAV